MVVVESHVSMGVKSKKLLLNRRKYGDLLQVLLVYVSHLGSRGLSLPKKGKQWVTEFLEPFVESNHALQARNGPCEITI